MFEMSSLGISPFASVLHAASSGFSYRRNSDLVPELRFLGCIQFAFRGWRNPARKKFGPLGQFAWAARSLRADADSPLRSTTIANWSECRPTCTTIMRPKLFSKA